MVLKTASFLPQQKLLFSTLFILLSIPAYQGIKLQEYDFVVGQGNNLIFLHTSSNASESVPVTALSKDLRGRITCVVPDLDSESPSIYFITTTKNSSSISVFHPDSNDTLEIFSGSKGSIGSLNLYKNYLYWSDESNKSSMRLPITNWTSPNTTPEIVFQDHNATFDSIAVDPASGVIYYTMWKRGNESKILGYDPKVKQSFVFVENVYQPKGLYVDVATNSLLWIDNPPGIYFTIERASLTKPLRELITKDQNQHPFSLSVHCSKIYWTDLINKAFWEFNPTTKTYQLIKYFNNVAPYGLSMTNVPIPENCKTEVETSTIAATNSPSTPGRKSNKECVGPSCWKSDDVSKVEVQESQRKVEFCNILEANQCRNGATCLKLFSEIRCLCPSGFSGLRCEDSQIMANSSNAAISSWSSDSPLFITSIVFSIIVLILVLVIGVLIVKLRKQASKPKIRRRVVVSHRSDIDTTGSSTVCEMIDIENCCNMNVCETPCYERMGSFSGSGSGTSSGRVRKNSGKEDKKCLLSA